MHKEHLEKNLEELQVLKSKWNGIRERLVRQLLEVQDTVFRCYYAAKWEDKRNRAQEERRQCWRVVLGSAWGVTVRGL